MSQGCLQGVWLQEVGGWGCQQLRWGGQGGEVGEGRWGALLWPIDIQVEIASGSEIDESGFDRREQGWTHIFALCCWIDR